MKKIKFILYCIALNCAVIFLSPLHFSVRFIGTAILLFFGGIFLLKRSPFQNKIINWFSIFGIWICLISALFIGSFLYSGFKAAPIFIISFFATALATILYKTEPKILLKSSILYMTFVGLSTYLLPNYYVFISHHKNEMISQPLPDLTIYNENGTLFDLKKEKGKILVFDLWNSSCGNCIKAFPKFDELKKEFKDDTTIRFYSVNIPLDRDIDKKEAVRKFTHEYSFQTLYADKNISKTLHIEAVPTYLIIDKNQTIRYVGDLNTEKDIFYNNFYDILNKIK
ncbi:TlpA disulfide reductase family protein [Flavobacterium sp. GT3R68]|uniref:TlpA family protein disulfide reductase n=1 Tax=Flavobacterium sp. GT3R68 TaxID=2594437 RepID=UPI00131527AD|nr:TlpA disulfide reductase family protein [Flavobacterium sp. GT3R68]